jgi:hypothetical protein
VVDLLAGGTAQDDAGAEEADAGDDALDDAAHGVGMIAADIGAAAGQHHNRGTERHQRMGTNTGRLAVNVPVEADGTAEHHGGHHAQDGVDVDFHAVTGKPSTA